MNRIRALTILLAASLAHGAGTATASASPQLSPPPQRVAPRPPVVPPNRKVEGKTYAEWSAAWWQWSLALPAVPGHPFFCDPPPFDVTLGQAGTVWFLGAAFEPCPHQPRAIAVPHGIKLFVALVNTESSSMEPTPYFGCTEAEQAASATAFANYIQNPFLVIDGVRLGQIQSYRVVSTQFEVILPVPNVLGVPAGLVSTCYVPSPPPMQLKGVGDGYFAMIRPLPVGQHTIRFGGDFVGTPFGDFGIDMTYAVTVY